MTEFYKVELERQLALVERENLRLRQQRDALLAVAKECHEWFAFRKSWTPDLDRKLDAAIKLVEDRK